MKKKLEDRIHFRFLKSEIIHCYTLYENEQKYDLNPPISIVIEDISIGGMGIMTNYDLKNGQIISFNYTFRYMPYELMLKVVWVKNLGHTKKVGVEFIAMPNGLVKEIKDYLNNKIIKI